ncbi:hypothetical protein COT29_03635 [Candidatus Micrarchaeota archaeon CG08_land_8_20_14_0_20_59_11]|nr:MAG: hypothetical protein COT29_03635 [Candidatus Micrarchaeota archaeon CG08_land_8_20_14_0_20_59_11]
MSIDYGDRVFWWGGVRLLVGDEVILKVGAPGLYVQSIGVNGKNIRLRRIAQQPPRYDKAQTPRVLQLQPKSESEVDVERLPRGTHLVLNGGVLEVMQGDKTVRFDGRTQWVLYLEQAGTAASFRSLPGWTETAIEFQDYSGGARKKSSVIPGTVKADTKIRSGESARSPGKGAQPRV